MTRSYDSMGRLLKETRVRAGSTGVEQLVTEHTYNAKGELIESKSPDGGISKSKYNAIGKVTLRPPHISAPGQGQSDYTSRLIGNRSLISSKFDD